jgi:hypothetical protein
MNRAPRQFKKAGNDLHQSTFPASRRTENCHQLRRATYADAYVTQQMNATLFRPDRVVQIAQFQHRSLSYERTVPYLGGERKQKAHPTRIECAFQQTTR